MSTPDVRPVPSIYINPTIDFRKGGWWITKGNDVMRMVGGCVDRGQDCGNGSIGDGR